MRQTYAYVSDKQTPSYRHPLVQFASDMQNPNVAKFSLYGNTAWSIR